MPPVKTPATIEFVGAQAALEFVIRENGKVVDRGTVTTPPMFSITDLRRWLSRHERTLLDQWRKHRDAADVSA